MDLEKFYHDINGDYNNTLARLGSKELIEHFVNQFLLDPTYSELLKAYKNHDIDNAFLSSHTLKGICYNLGFTSLGGASSELTEILRKHTFENSSRILENVKEEYNKILLFVNN